MARDPLRKLRPPTAKQKQARDRNWRVWRLRGLWWNAFPLTGERLTAFRAAIDAELESLGAEPQGRRNGRLQQEADAFERFRSALIGDLPVF